jgi:hypothetical protein
LFCGTASFGFVVLRNDASTGLVILVVNNTFEIITTENKSTILLKKELKSRYNVLIAMEYIHTCVLGSAK